MILSLLQPFAAIKLSQHQNLILSSVGWMTHHITPSSTATSGSSPEKLERQSAEAEVVLKKSMLAIELCRRKQTNDASELACERRWRPRPRRLETPRDHDGHGGELGGKLNGGGEAR